MRKLAWTTIAIGTSLFLGLAACGEPKPAQSPSDTNEVDTSSPPTATPTAPKLPTDSTPPKSANVYDKEATEVVLKRAARSVKDSCGDAKDENGLASGPWGKVTIQVMLGRNGHSKDVTVPGSHADKASGRCIVNAFSNLHFPPWAGQDTQIDWEVELVQPPPPPPAPPKKK